MTDGTQRRRWAGRLRNLDPAPVPQPRPAPSAAAGPGDGLVERTAMRARLRERLRAGDVALHGIGGIGKTTLARQVARDLGDEFPGGVLWAAVGQETTGPALAALITGLLDRLTGDRPGVVTPARAGQLLAAELRRRPPTLLIVDDVWTREQLGPFLGGGRLLITTRVSGLLPAEIPSVHVGAMTHDEATALLTRDLPGLPLPDRTALHALTGRWPLLTAIANGILRGGTAAHQLIDRLGADGWVALDLTVPGERERAVDAFVTAALDPLPDPERRRYLELGIFPQGGRIPEAVLGSLWAAAGGLSSAETGDLCTAFARLGLVERERGALRLSDVLRAYLRNRLPDHEIAQVNRSLVEAVRPRDGAPWWTLSPSDRYLWRHLAFHLREARWWDELFATVTQVRRLAVQISLLGVAAAVADLAGMPDPRAAALCARLSRGAHLLHSIDPAESLTDVLLSRLAGAPELAAEVAAFAAERRSRAGLTARWPLPDVGPDSLLRVITGDSGWLDRVAISPNADWIATSGGDTGVITLHDWTQGTVLARLTGHIGAVKALVATHDGAMIASAGADGTLRLWDVRRRQERTLWAVDGEILGCAAAPSSHRIAAVSASGELIVLDVAGNWRILGHRGSEKLVGCAFLDDDRVLTITEDGAVAGHELRIGRRKTFVAAGRAPVTGFAVGAEWVAVGGADGEIRVHPLRGGGTPVTLGGHRGCVSAMAASGDRIISGAEDGTVRIFDRYGAEVAAVRAHPSWVTGCVVGPDRRTLITAGSDGTIRFWDLPRLVQETVGGPVDWVNSCAVSGSALVSGGEDGAVRCWRNGAGTAIWSGEWPVRRCVVGPDGSWIVAARDDSTVVLRHADQVWEAEVLPGASGCAASAELFAAWGEQGELTVRSVPDGESFRTVHERPIRAAAFLPHHRLVFADDAGLHLWHYRKGRVRPVGSMRGALAIQVVGPAPAGAAGRPAAEGRGAFAVLREGAWGQACGALRDSARRQGLGLLRGGRGSRIAVIGAFGVSLFEARGLRPIATADFPDGPVSHGAVSPDGQWLATTTRTGELRIRPLGATAPRMSTLSGVRQAVLRGGRALPAASRAASPGGAPGWQPVAAMRVDGALFECAWAPDGPDLYAAGRRGIYAFTFRPPGPTPAQRGPAPGDG
ncbi:NB-ARC domain-containing protein [Actinoplanes siamensis]|uniref:NB-ARC domain-containing protein n=1 Tax=Actinoplanes siamensis TaxID=1223317 RepID=A0A919NAU0_9ACTN|nr:NB-ARC domain-containing protein [Actinoplanes siamensis]GIF07400.1 hypothetical protein Asi03nite_49380 [Actinoplanes siamensis]